MTGLEEGAPSGGDPISKEPKNIFEPGNIIEDDDKAWDLEGIMTAKKVDTTGLRGKGRALKEKFHSASVEISLCMSAVVALAEQSLSLCLR